MGMGYCDVGAPLQCPHGALSALEECGASVVCLFFFVPCLSLWRSITIGGRISTGRISIGLISSVGGRGRTSWMFFKWMDFYGWVLDLSDFRWSTIFPLDVCRLDIFRLVGLLLDTDFYWVCFDRSDSIDRITIGLMSVAHFSTGRLLIE